VTFTSFYFCSAKENYNFIELMAFIAMKVHLVVDKFSAGLT